MKPSLKLLSLLTVAFLLLWSAITPIPEQVYYPEEFVSPGQKEWGCDTIWLDSLSQTSFIYFENDSGYTLMGRTSTQEFAGFFYSKESLEHEIRISIY